MASAAVAHPAQPDRRADANVHNRAYQAYQIQHFVFTAAPILAGAALRDFGLLLAAVALGRLAGTFDVVSEARSGT